MGNTQEATGHVVWATGWAVGVVDGWMVSEGQGGVREQSEMSKDPRLNHPDI